MRTAALFLSLAFLLAPAPGHANALARDRDPILLTGADLPLLLGTDPADLVAFRWEGAWIQIPVQVDERKIEDFGVVYDSTAIGQTLLTYADAGTFTGPDSDPLLDADDEIALRASDAGDLWVAAGAPPPGALPGTGVELRITDLLSGQQAYAYLFEGDGSLDPSAGLPDIAYDFVLLSGDYLTTYDTRHGPNPEDSRVATSAYSVHFSDRWIRDETAVFSGGATGVDILDRHKSMFAPGNCSRTEDTFSAGEGAFLVNRTGPVRALRGYVGANSGITTYRVHKFYEQREDVETYLRVHAIPGILDMLDFEPAATGMIYHNDLNPAGVVVDGIPDVVTAGPIQWQMVTGGQGTLVSSLHVRTDIPGFDYGSYYSDDTTPIVTQCTGDAFEYGSAGMWETDPIPNTDPSLGAFYRFEPVTVISYGPPSQDVAFAEARHAEAGSPLAVLAVDWNPPTGVAVAPAEARTRIVVSPNPAGNAVNVRLALPRAGRVELRLVDRTATSFRNAGGQELPLDVSRHPAGVYWVTARVNGEAGPSARLVLVR